MAAAVPGAVPGGMVAPVLFPIAPLMPPAVPHIFTRCTPLGVEPELDYLRVPTGCAVVRAFPLMEWVDVSAIFPGHMAAPAWVEWVFFPKVVGFFPIRIFVHSCASVCIFVHFIVFLEH